MAGHALRGNVSRWITKICGHSNLIYSEFHHISSRLFIYRKKADYPCLLLIKKIQTTIIKGKLPEWSNGPHSKCGDRVTGPGVRIPHFPQTKRKERRGHQIIDLVLFFMIIAGKRELALKISCDYHKKDVHEAMSGQPLLPSV